MKYRRFRKTTDMRERKKNRRKVLRKRRQRKARKSKSKNLQRQKERQRGNFGITQSRLRKATDIRKKKQDKGIEEE